MASKDLYNNVKTAQSLAPAARNASANGLSVSLVGYHSALVIIDAGVRTDGTHTFEVQDSPDDSVWTAVADAKLQGTEPVIDTGGEGSQVYEIGYLGGKKHLRVIVTVAGATTGLVAGASIMRGHPAEAPTR